MKTVHFRIAIFQIWIYSPQCLKNVSFITVISVMPRLAILLFKNVFFKDCKLVGLQFENSNPLLLSFSF